MTKPAMYLALAMAAVGFSLLSAQSNEVLDTVLGEASLSYGDAAYLVGSASGRLQDAVSPADAAAALDQAGLGIPGRAPDSSVSLGEFSYMLTRAFGMRGGIMYSILPGPRYATRELAYLGIITGPAIPGMSLSGERALRILERAVHRKEAAR